MASIGPLRAGSVEVGEYLGCSNPQRPTRRDDYVQTLRYPGAQHCELRGHHGAVSAAVRFAAGGHRALVHRLGGLDLNPYPVADAPNTSASSPAKGRLIVENDCHFQ